MHVFGLANNTSVVWFMHVTACVMAILANGVIFWSRTMDVVSWLVVCKVMVLGRQAKC